MSMKLYHGTSKQNRQSILERGLMRFPIDDHDPHLGGIFFHTVAGLPSEYLDIWEVETAGIELERDTTTEHDESDPWWVCWDVDITPDRLILRTV